MCDQKMLRSLEKYPSLLYLELATAGGTNNGRIVVNGFRCLKYFSLGIDHCGTALEFKEGSMPKLEHLKLRFFVHKMECLNGAPNMGIQHLSSLSKVEVKIRGDRICHTNYDPTEDLYDDSVRYVARAISASVNTLSNCPTIRFETEDHGVCEPFESVRKEKLGDRQTELQQLVSPFGKSLSAPYLKNRQQVPHLKVSRDDDGEAAAAKGGDLTGRGLCLVPISSTFAVASDKVVTALQQVAAALGCQYDDNLNNK
ncbi:hypothetical protein BAE44_0011525 [Dichanthelium oligosanthes]|uniref:Disease resistance R13L4/SHOC-2-like LRR domain-containing protein n=1 Tax=Dichanthelium oligosanthes TaxID=888268 RepID=A0A1E5VQT1_9POAL|nr:hypothetical protein BAE44_0011525 [Dichanthelium oligosanthes]